MKAVLKVEDFQNKCIYFIRPKVGGRVETVVCVVDYGTAYITEVQEMVVEVESHFYQADSIIDSHDIIGPVEVPERDMFRQLCDIKKEKELVKNTPLDFDKAKEVI